MGNEGIENQVASIERANGRTVIWRINGANYVESQNIHASLKPYSGRTPEDNVRIASDNAYSRKMALAVSYQRQELGPRLVSGMDPSKDILAEELLLADWHPKKVPEPRAPWRNEGTTDLTTPGSP